MYVDNANNKSAEIEKARRQTDGSYDDTYNSSDKYNLEISDVAGKKVLEIVNKARASQKLTPLKWCQTLADNSKSYNVAIALWGRVEPYSQSVRLDRLTSHQEPAEIVT
jgi:hypothetical protein